MQVDIFSYVTGTARKMATVSLDADGKMLIDGDVSPGVRQTLDSAYAHASSPQDFLRTLPHQFTGAYIRARRVMVQRHEAIPATDQSVPAVTRVFHDVPAVAFGGAGSGNFGHAGRPGEVGGSGPGEGARGTGDGDGTSGTYANGSPRPKPFKCSSIDEAIDRVLKGQIVELPDVKGAATLIDKLAELTIAAQKAGKDAPNIDLCKVTVKNTNLFCESRVTTEEHPEGIPRINMPQFAGFAEPGSDADKLPRDKFGMVDSATHFNGHLRGLGLSVKTGTIASAHLKASQAELVGSKIALMAQGPRITPDSGAIWVSRDSYVIDGHHRWAAAVAQDARDGKLGDSKLQVIMVDAPITEILKLANAWTRKFGIRSASGKKH